MTKEEMVIYANRYRKVQTRLSYGLGVFIFLICAVLIFVSVLMYVYNGGSYILIVVGVIMDLLAIGDTFLGIKFFKYSRNHFKEMKDKDAAEHYCKIHGFDPKIKEKAK